MLNEKKYQTILKIFLCLYPLFSLKIFYNSYFTLLQIFFIFAFLSYTYFFNKSSRHNFKYLILYYILIIIYGICHHLNALNFTSLVPDNFNYNFFDEILYLLKMSIPIPFIYLLYYSNLNQKDYSTILKSWLILISGSIIITNLLGISLGSYTDEVIKGNIFSWFNKSFIYKETASKGFFMYSNTISGILVSMIPLVMSYYFNDKINYKYLIIMLLSLLMIGTRIANIGSILVFIVMIIAYLFFTILKKEKLKWKLLIISITLSIVYLLILPYSPTISRYKVYDYLLDSKRLIANASDTYLSDIKYIEENYQEREINENFITNSYPYEYDPEFWLKILREPIKKRADYRYLEISMIKRVVEVNNNKMDIFFGITNDRIQNIFNIERGFVLEYYAFGIVGFILFLGIYFALLLKNIFILFKRFTLNNMSFAFSSFLVLLISYLSGNIFTSLPAVIILLILMLNYEKA